MWLVCRHLNPTFMPHSNLSQSTTFSAGYIPPPIFLWYPGNDEERVPLQSEKDLLSSRYPYVHCLVPATCTRRTQRGFWFLVHRWNQVSWKMSQFSSGYTHIWALSGTRHLHPGPSTWFLVPLRNQSSWQFNEGRTACRGGCAFEYYRVFFDCASQEERIFLSSNNVIWMQRTVYLLKHLRRWP